MFGFRGCDTRDMPLWSFEGGGVVSRLLPVALGGGELPLPIPNREVKPLAPMVLG